MDENQPNLKDYIKTLAELTKHYSNFSLKDRLDNLEQLKETRKGLELSLDSVNTKILVLETMPDVAEQKAMTDKVSRGILKYLGQHGHASYRALAESDKVYHLVIMNRVSWLETIGLVKIDREKNPAWPVIKLTERGKNLRYAETPEKENDRN